MKARINFQFNNSISGNNNNNNNNVIMKRRIPNGKVGNGTYVGMHNRSVTILGEQTKAGERYYVRQIGINKSDKFNYNN